MRGEAYDVFVAAFVEAVGELFPHALLHWEDFGPGNGRRLLERYGDQLCTFNDDLQGTGAITLACVLNAARVSGTPLRDQRIVVFGAGTAGVGIADQLRDAMVRDGLDHEEATRRIWPRRPVEARGRPAAGGAEPARLLGRGRRGRRPPRRRGGRRDGPPRRRHPADPGRHVAARVPLTARALTARGLTARGR
ncbi:malic enzyme-like NAD(P)-binding protein [Streptomyces sp. NPDC050121]|uniref:malic enzyme-like NAD(P)-binding protein n=1 Tax=Streptomyces sp. NPDC050121 TaxID=3365601 RepID=UPI00378B8169